MAWPETSLLSSEEGVPSRLSGIPKLLASELVAESVSSVCEDCSVCRSGDVGAEPISVGELRVTEGLKLWCPIEDECRFVSCRARFGGREGSDSASGRGRLLLSCMLSARRICEGQRRDIL